MIYLLPDPMEFNFACFNTFDCGQDMELDPSLFTFDMLDDFVAQ